MKSTLVFKLIIAGLALVFLSCSSTEDPAETENMSTITIDDAVYDVYVSKVEEVNEVYGEPLRAIEYGVVGSLRSDESVVLTLGLIQAKEGAAEGRTLLALQADESMYRANCNEGDDETMVLESLRKNGSGMILSENVTLCKIEFTNGTVVYTPVKVKFNIHTS